CATRLSCRCRYRRDRLSFPTRRSSDLGQLQIPKQDWLPPSLLTEALDRADKSAQWSLQTMGAQPAIVVVMADQTQLTATFEIKRSEEHTSELQSRENLVCRLLLEKTNR